MRKDLQKRLLAVAAILDRTTAEVKLADGDDRENFWKKFFYKEPKIPTRDVVPDKAQPLPEPKTMIAPEAPRTKEQPAPAAKLPAPAKDPIAPVEDIVAFLHGGPVPLAVLNPLATLAKGLAGAGAISEKDVKSVVVFMAKMLRKYVGGQRLAQVEETPEVSASDARRARIAARKAEIAENKSAVAEYLNQHEPEKRAAAAGVLREALLRNGADWAAFYEQNKEHLAAFITEAGELVEQKPVETPAAEPPKQASFREQIAAIAEAKK